ncbi:MAG: flavodoxin family protein [Anaerolineae bacterium]|nr:flavodoxin family protein [Anaerolineae bacterium]
MKILTLIGSYRKKGNTARIVQMVAAQLEALATQQQLPLDFEALYLGDMDVRPCRGCRTCFDRGEDKCPLKDDVPGIRARMDAADAVILASPVYVDDVSGVVKNWLDRLAYVCHRPAFGGKCAFSIATVGDSPTARTLRTMNAALLTWGFHLVGQAGYKMGALMPADEAEKRFQKEASGIAGKVFRAVVAQQALRPSFVSLLTFKVQQLAWQNEPSDSFDRAYWKNQGWLERDRTFYIAHRASRAKVALARLAGAAVARVLI